MILQSHHLTVGKKQVAMTDFRDRADVDLLRNSSPPQQVNGLFSYRAPDARTIVRTLDSHYPVNTNEEVQG